MYKHLGAKSCIHIGGARQHNLKNLTLDIALNALTVVTGVSGSGKSSLVFDTLYAEGQRRYVETFSPYARQFLDRMDKPQVDCIEGVPPAIAIDQTNPVRTSRSTVGTMTELADYFKLLYARAARLYCDGCGAEVRHEDSHSIVATLYERVAQQDLRLVVTFPVIVPANFAAAELEQLLERQGYTRIHGRKLEAEQQVLHVVQDRFRLTNVDSSRVAEAVETALLRGKGQLAVYVLPPAEAAPPGQSTETRWRFSTGLHCADCDIHYAEASPGLFSFNSPLGACECCRGFGRVIGVDDALVIPDESKTLVEGAVKPWQSPSFRECQDDMARMARQYGVAMDVPFRDLPPEHQRWVRQGDAQWRSWKSSWPRKWYGIQHFFDWLETRAYKMHIRVLLSRYRSYSECPACQGGRLRPEALRWRLTAVETDGAGLSTQEHYRLPALMALPVQRLRSLVDALQLPRSFGEGGDLLLGEIRARLGYLVDVGLGYLSLDRQSRTLSGGEVQRINLTSALGASLVNTLFVLDEPSIGLHPRDIERILGVMTRLRDVGNTLVVVEHDPQIMRSADYLLDIGPGPGELGGEIVAYARVDEVAANPRSLTGAYLSGRRRVDANREKRAIDAATPCLELYGVCRHNLCGLDVRFPLTGLVCVAGVSGSGKSTLIQDVLYPALARHFKQSLPTTTFGVDNIARIEGLSRLTGVVMVDQSPIGKSARSSPVSYIGAWDAIRKLFAALPQAVELGLSPASFSFNAGNGRCPGCAGSGFEHVEMQFLSDVYLRCPDCDGKRYRPEILELQWQGKSVAEVLDMTVSEASSFFGEQLSVYRALSPLVDVGLEYIRLGQPVPTLSGGEAQRLKLAGHLAEAVRRGGARTRKAEKQVSPLLFLFDEPTTGLHFEDVTRLLQAFDKLLDAGHALVVIEHNLDVLLAADWILELGPEGGEAGGQLIASGLPAQLMVCRDSHTGRALQAYQRQYEQGKGLGFSKAVPKAAEALSHYALAVREGISIRHAREHNLQNLSVTLPRNQLTVITGLSGSGKSTLAFDIVFGEGQRRYLASLNAYARQFIQPAARPDVDAVHGLAPTVAIEQRLSQGGRKSTVGTLTEIQPYLRLLYTRLGTQHCPDCGLAVEPQHFDAIVAQIQQDYVGRKLWLLAPLVVNRKGLYKDLAKWALAKGYPSLWVDGEEVLTTPWPRLDRYKEHCLDLPVGELVVSFQEESTLRALLACALEYGKGMVRVRSAEAQERVFSTRRACPACGRSFPEPDPRLFSYNAKHGWCPACYGTGMVLAGKVEDPNALDVIDDCDVCAQDCPACGGARLNPVARAVRFRGLGIHQLSAYTATQLLNFVNTLSLNQREQAIARDLLAEIASRLDFLTKVGLPYLTLARGAPTLSGGEAQRIRLAAQLGSNLRGVCYVLDEPTIGLHPRDNHLLLDILEALRDRGNSLLVVEHDEETIRRADHLLDLGPGAGIEGGTVVAQGTLADLMQVAASPTGACLRSPLRHPMQARRPVGRQQAAIVIREASLNNLKGIDVRIPLGRFVVISGVSGSGKSTLARDVLLANLTHLFTASARSKDKCRDASMVVKGCRSIEGWQQLGRILEVNQNPIGKTPRSCPATYVGFWDTVRKLFADTFDARTRGWKAGRFSFNTGMGRCPVCSGQGQVTVEMSFLPNIKQVCEACGGSRFNAETRTVTWRGKSVADVLQMAVDEAVDFFASHPSIARPLELMQAVGLGYLTLGQASPTLSGGEAQRIKLVTELSRAPRTVSQPKSLGADGKSAEKHTLYVLDEPTVGLHMADVAKLIKVIHQLVDAGQTVVAIEHDLDVMAEADWLIDLGPEGGDGGGELLVQGTPEKACRQKSSHTGRILSSFLAVRR